MMSDYQGPYPIRSSASIQQDLLQHAFERVAQATPGRSPAEIQQLIAIFLAKAREMPAEHRAALVALDLSEPRAVLQLNRLAQEIGSQWRYTSDPAKIEMHQASFDPKKQAMQPMN